MRLRAEEEAEDEEEDEEEKKKKKKKQQKETEVEVREVDEVSRIPSWRSSAAPWDDLCRSKERIRRLGAELYNISDTCWTCEDANKVCLDCKKALETVRFQLALIIE